MSYNNNYFVNHIYSYESVLHFEAWANWQQLNNNTDAVTGPTAARKNYLKEIKTAITWGKENDKNEFVNKLNTLLTKTTGESAPKLKKILVQIAKNHETQINALEKDAETVQSVITTLLKNLENLIAAGSDTTEQSALNTFYQALGGLLSSRTLINPMRPIASGVLDTTGSDSLWPIMLAQNESMRWLSHPPVEYQVLNVRMHDTIRNMCQQLIDKCRNSSKLKCGKENINIIKPVTIPADVGDEYELQAQTVHIVLEALRCIWKYTSHDHVMSLNEGTYAKLISRFFEVFEFGETDLNVRWAEEGSEASSKHDRVRKPDMRIKLFKPDLEILFFESSRPKADVQKFIWDWVKLVRMSKDAHDVMFEFMTKDRLNHLQGSAQGKEFLQKLSAVPIIMIQLHGLEMRISVLDRPHLVYYRARELETFTIPLTPIEDSQTLEDFVSRWLKLQRYIESLACQLKNLEAESNAVCEDTFFQRRDPSSKKIERLPTPSTPNASSMMDYDLTKP